MTASATKSDSTFRILQLAHEALTSAYVEVHQRGRATFWGRPIIDAHLRRRTTELRDAFIQAGETDFRSPKQSAWLNGEADRLGNLGSTFHWKWDPGRLKGVTAVFGFPGVAAVVGLTGISAAVLAILQKCLCHLVGGVPLVASAALGITFLVGFDSKRRLFLEASEQPGGIYALGSLTEHSPNEEVA
jgi:hypothetical protein